MRKEMDRGIKYKMDLIRIGLETTKYKALGTVALFKKQSFSDLLNNGKKFIVLKDVKVSPLDSEGSSYEKEYLMVNKDFIVLSWEE